MKHEGVPGTFQRYLNAPLNKKKILTISVLSGAALVLGTRSCNDDDMPAPPPDAIDVGEEIPAFSILPTHWNSLKPPFTLKLVPLFTVGPPARKSKC